MNLADITTKKNTERSDGILLYGVEGIGKTTFGTDLPSPYFICFEDGLIEPEFEGIDRTFPNTWADALRAIDLLINEKHSFKSVVFDTVDSMQKQLFDYISISNNSKNIECVAGGFGKGYKMASFEIAQLISRVEQLQKKDVLVCMLCHASIRNFPNPEGESYDRYEPQIQKDVYSPIKKWADEILFANYKTSIEKKKATGGKERVLYTQRCAAYDAKNRFGLPEEIPFDAPTLLTLMKAGGNDGLEKMVEEIKTLLPGLPETARVSVEKWLSEKKYTVTSVARTLEKCKKQSTQNGDKVNA